MEGSLVAIDWTLAVQAVNFLIFMVLINKFLFQPLLNLMEEREKELEVHHSEVEALRAKAEALLKEVDQVLNEAKVKAKTFVEEAVKEAKKERDKLLKEAHEKATAKIENSKKEIWGAFETERQKLESEAEKIAEEIVRKILGKKAA
ncbi:ATP synthase F0 subunit B [Desulfurobacterium thermolithotrophum]|uniref:ATP synthase F0 subunit B n=1 Tax=Desulfurobacterium thermolithotrophum TaxID=64160 RepID=UPI0013D6531A|nr:ATP synthase F0 subunit B [Desulfurobacterium thermolithotrophum]